MMILVVKDENNFFMGPGSRGVLYPPSMFAKDYPRKAGLPNFKMLDEVTHKVPDPPTRLDSAKRAGEAGGSTHNLFAEPPVYLPLGWDTNPTNPTNAIMIRSETNDSDMIFKTTIDVPDNCTECMVILKQSFHPNWQATIDGKPALTFTVFPFYLATLVPAGTHEVVFSYEPSKLKVVLLIIEFSMLAFFIMNCIRSHVIQ